MQVLTGAAMRTAWTVLLLLLIPAAVADTTVHLHATQDDGTAAGLAYVHDGGTAKTHQNMALQVVADGRTWFVTDNLHEHDGIATFHTGIFGDTSVIVEGDELSTATISGERTTTRSSIQVEHDDSTVRIQGDGPMVGEWVARDADGVLARGWFDADTAIHDLVQINIDGTHRIEIRPVDGDVQTVILGPMQAEDRLRPIPPENEALPCGADVRLDPEEVLTGNPVRITVGDLATMGRVEYRLMQEVDVLNEYEALQWASTAAAGASSFRAPAAGVYTLHVTTEEDGSCVVPINAKAGSPETAEPTWSFVQEGKDVVFTADVDNQGHYEFPVWVSMDDGQGSRLLWAGKLHSHGGPVDFRIPDAPVGDYRVRFDVGAQDADPVVPSESGWMGRASVAEEDAPHTTPAPVGALALLAVAFVARRW